MTIQEAVASQNSPEDTSEILRILTTSLKDIPRSLPYAERVEFRDNLNQALANLVETGEWQISLRNGVTFQKIVPPSPPPPHTQS